MGKEKSPFLKEKNNETNLIHNYKFLAKWLLLSEKIFSALNQTFLS